MIPPLARSEAAGPSQHQAIPRARLEGRCPGSSWAGVEFLDCKPNAWVSDPGREYTALSWSWTINPPTQQLWNQGTTVGAGAREAERNGSTGWDGGGRMEGKEYGTGTSWLGWKREWEGKNEERKCAVPFPLFRKEQGHVHRRIFLSMPSSMASITKSGIVAVIASLNPGTSPVDWCEDNYTFTPDVAEFINTISNVLFIVLPPLMMVLFRPYARLVQREINVIWILLLIIGFSSAYFHATLSLMGQLLDEISILWTFMAGVGMWCPLELMPSFCRQSRTRFKWGILLLTIFCTILACLYPAINAFFLMCLGIPGCMFMAMHLKRSYDPRIVRLGYRSTFLWGLGVLCWISDRMFCNVWRTHFKFPYLHGAWHVLIALASYTSIVLFAYFHTQTEMPNKRPQIRYWPTDKWEVICVPYVEILEKEEHLPSHKQMKEQHLKCV
ncbi:unnamed protein product [Cyprideis torosa]|uniref:ceramidase n=1 Tax=Cyprideis torosa TaxID=163714 RepID=A0A7R8VZW9_9CRUS|nr:unnamed protein product [Cyprideis torosa]CAG0879127.1 unnamed protein product [Cyprideis torosa]